MYTKIVLVLAVVILAFLGIKLFDQDSESLSREAAEPVALRAIRQSSDGGFFGIDPFGGLKDFAETLALNYEAYAPRASGQVAGQSPARTGAVTSNYNDQKVSGPALEGRMTPWLYRQVSEAEIIMEAEDPSQISIDYLPATPEQRGGATLLDWEVRRMLDGEKEEQQALVGVVRSPATDVPTKLDILSQIRPVFEDQTDYYIFLTQILEDSLQPAQVRVNAFRHLADIDGNAIDKYLSHSFEPVSSEADLLYREVLYEQSKRSGSDL